MQIICIFCLQTAEEVFASLEASNFFQFCWNSQILSKLLCWSALHQNLMTDRKLDNCCLRETPRHNWKCKFSLFCISFIASVLLFGPSVIKKKNTFSSWEITVFSNAGSPFSQPSHMELIYNGNKPISDNAGSYLHISHKNALNSS